MEIKSFSEVTPEHIQDLKARHGVDLFQVTIKGKSGDKEPTATFIIKEPNRTVIDLVGQHSANKDVPATNKVLISNCVLAGDMEIMEKSAAVYSQLLLEINALVKKKEASVKKL